MIKTVYLEVARVTALVGPGFEDNININKNINTSLKRAIHGSVNSESFS